MCNNSELIIGLVYGELEDAERAAVESHLHACAECRNEVAELRAARGHLAAWAPPEPDFGFEIVRSTPRLAPASATPAPRFRFAPAWGLAAAAVLVLATAAAIANIEVRYDAQGLVVRTGWAREATLTPGETGGPIGIESAALTPVNLQAEIAAVNQRLRELEDAAKQHAATVQVAAGPRMTDAEILRRVREMLNHSESRQQRELVTQIGQVIRDVDTARQMDFARIQQSFGQWRGQTSAEVANQFNRYLSRVSQQK